MAQKDGTVSQNSSKYSYYLIYSYSFDANKMKWTVAATAYLVVHKYRYTGNTSYAVYIGGNAVASQGSTSQTRGDNKTSVTYTVGSGSYPYDALATARSVGISATLSAASGGYGPGTCSASVTISLPAKLSSAGKMTVGSVSEEHCTLSVSGLSTTLGYARTCTFQYKKSTASTWTALGTNSVAATGEGCTRTVTDLLPGTKYDFRCIVTAPSGTTLVTLTGSATTSTDPITVDFDSVNYYDATILVKDLISVSDYARTIKGFYRVAGESDWIAGPTSTHAADKAIGTPSLKFTDLQDGVDYEFKIEVYYGSVLSTSSNLSATTPINEDYTIVDPVIDEGMIIVEITDNKENNFIGKVSAYAREAEMPYEFLGTVDADFKTTPKIKFDWPYDKEGTEATTVKTIFHEPDDKVKEIFQLMLNTN